jgi:hypothetical protein
VIVKVPVKLHFPIWVESLPNAGVANRNNNKTRVNLKNFIGGRILSLIMDGNDSHLMSHNLG